ncbi:methionyl-tRNA formyltransferase (plasmid) [Haloferacaceae archaeon DSL9]
MAIPSDRSVVYASCTIPGYEVLQTLLDNEIPVSHIVSITPEMAETHDVVKYRSFESIADEHDIPIYYPSSYSMGSEDAEFFEELSADLMIVNGWQRLIPGDVLETFTYGALGNHGSAFGLPKGRGRSPLNWSLIEDLDRFLLSVIRLDPGVDSGAVAATRKFDINEFDTIQTLYYKVTLSMQEMLLDIVEPILRGEHQFRTQDGDPTYYPKRNPEDGELHWEEPMGAVYNLVRAVTRPYPGAFTRHDGERVEIWDVKPFSTDFGVDAQPGEIIRVFETGDFAVSTPDGSVIVTEWVADSWTPKAGMVFESTGRPDRVDSYDQKHHLTSAESSDD